MVASTHWLASAAGMATLEHGGNAFDAAVAAGLVLQVVEPHLNGLGGEAPIVGFDAGAGAAFVVDGQGPAPRAATLETFACLGLELVPGTGVLPACVPGAFGAWMLLLRRYGRLRLRDVMGYAIGYAEGGYPVLASTSAAIAGVERVFRSHWPGSAELYLSGGLPLPGSRFANPALAGTYRRLLAEGEASGPDRDSQIEAARTAFYRGFVAEAVASYLAAAPVPDATGAAHHGLLAYEDLAGWEPGIEDPATFDYRGLTVCKTGPWGQGPVFLQQLALLEGFDLAGMGIGSVGLVHTVVECAKLAFADREAWYGDPRFVDVPLAALLDPGYSDRRRAEIGDTARSGLHPGSPGGRVPRLANPPTGAGSGAGLGEPTLGSAGPSDGDTCHVDVADRFGNMVSATPSGGWLQSSPVLPGLGFCLGTRAQMFWLEPGLAASLEPNKRPRTTLSPGLVLRDGDAYMAFGTPGGDQQDQWALQVFLGHVDFGLDLQAAIDAPAFHTSHFPSSFHPRQADDRRVVVEAGFGGDVVAALQDLGHDVVVAPPWSLGRVSAVSRGAGGLLHAAANPRGMQGYAVGR
jgi:gamma-glutamyltranspeptidase/glutathione hydrolase